MKTPSAEFRIGMSGQKARSPYLDADLLAVVFVAGLLVTPVPFF